VKGRLVVFLGAVLLVAMAAEAAAADDPPAQNVRLVIDYGDGVETHYKQLAWREGMTALDALAAVKAHPRGVSFGHRGSGTSTLVTKIGDLENEGGGAKSKNWLYFVNGKAATVGAGAYKLKAGDTVLWKFQTYSYNPG
jgi:hypothetical protein